MSTARDVALTEVCEETWLSWTNFGGASGSEAPRALDSLRDGPGAGFGYCTAHSRRYWGFKLVLLCAPDGTIVDFDLVAANSGEREAALALLEANPLEGTTIFCDKGCAGSREIVA